MLLLIYLQFNEVIVSLISVISSLFFKFIFLSKNSNNEFHETSYISKYKIFYATIVTFYSKLVKKFVWNSKTYDNQDISWISFIFASFREKAGNWEKSEIFVKFVNIVLWLYICHQIEISIKLWRKHIDLYRRLSQFFIIAISESSEQES